MLGENGKCQCAKDSEPFCCQMCDFWETCDDICDDCPELDDLTDCERQPLVFEEEE